MLYDNNNEPELSKKIERTEDVICEDNILFTQLNLKELIIKGLSFNGFKCPSPIQTKAIPMGLLGLDLIIQAKSGTGKTCVFSVLALECITVSSKIPQVLIVSPTREIAFQSLNVIQSIGCFIEDLSCQLFIGGIKVHEDLKKVKNCHIVVGTPGRIKYLIEENHIQTDSIRLLILDEADMLFTDNFQNTMNFIYNSLPMNKQMLTLSATYTNEMVDTIITYMNSPIMIRLSKNEEASLLGIKHYYKQFEDDLSPREVFWSKTTALLDILSSVDFQQCIVFSNYQYIAQDLCEVLESKGWPSAYISGNLDQKQRIDVYNKLKNFHCRVLITTDLTSRGIDAENVNLVINLDIPWDFETYLHRMGRAGRYGSYGVVISIVTKEEFILLNNIKAKCFINFHQLPNKIPCDLLNSRNCVNTDNVVVQKLSKSEKSYNIHEIFQVYRNCNSENNLESVIISETIGRRLSKMNIQNNFYDIFAKYQTRKADNDIFKRPPISDGFNLNLFNVIENQIYKEVNFEQNNKIINEITQDFDKIYNEIFDLENEFNRLSEWSKFYSNQFQISNEQITIKTIELNRYINWDLS